MITFFTVAFSSRVNYIYTIIIVQYLFVEKYEKASRTILMKEGAVFFVLDSEKNGLPARAIQKQPGIIIKWLLKSRV